jgi:hypothetical protein
VNQLPNSSLQPTARTLAAAELGVSYHEAQASPPTMKMQSRGSRLPSSDIFISDFAMELNELMNRFRIASREVFNHFFRVPDPYNNDGWLLEERFSEVQAVLFQKLVLEPSGLSEPSYGAPQPCIRVVLRHSEFAPIMINRGIDTGYWDFPLREVTKDAHLTFIQFFDWDQLAYRDNQYVRVQIESWPSHPEVVGRHALVESQYVSFIQV